MTWINNGSSSRWCALRNRWCVLVSGDDMDKWLVKRMYDVDRLHVEIEKLLMNLVGFWFIRGIDNLVLYY